MISHVIEYSCQYSDQIRKKHKIWHDGKLKYYQVNSRFMLYPEDSNVLIASNFISNQREISRILDTEGFNTVEHKIFSRAVVIITDILCEYDREIQHQKADQSQTSSSQHKRSLGSDSDFQNKKNKPSNSQLSRARPSQKIPRRRVLISDKEERTGENGKVSLALKFNKPFKPPAVVNKYLQNVEPKYRPAHRNTRTLVQGYVSGINHTVSKTNKDGKTEEEMAQLPERMKIENENRTENGNFIAKTELSTRPIISIRRGRNFKRKHISHTPINI